MKAADLQILLVADDCDLVVAITQELMLGLPASLTVSDNIAQARSLAATGAFDTIIACRKVRDGNGLSLLAELEAAEISSPVILVDTLPDSELLLTALRMGAADVLNFPGDQTRLSSAVRAAASKRRDQLQLASRTRRLRKLSSRLVRDRRDLRKRVDLLCRDIVTAYRRLAEKVSSDQPGDQFDRTAWMSEELDR